MNEQQILIWDYLEKHAVSISNTVHINKIAEDLGFPPYGTNNDDVRNHIKTMVVDYNLPIGTCEDGVFLFTSDREREVAAKFVERRSRANIIRNIDYYTSE
jgi:hypothetical protein